jgi:hypothetical protein
MAVKRYDLSDREEDTWGFLCECGAEECQEWVTLRVTDYEAYRHAERPILAPGHTLTQVQKSRRTARHLIAEARALRAQAEVQLKRAARNLKKSPPD